MRNCQALYYNVYTSLMADPKLYLTTLIIIVVALLPDILIQVFILVLIIIPLLRIDCFKMKHGQVWTSSKIRLKPKANKTMPYIDPVT